MRVANWPQVLAGKIEEWRPRALVYGETDCCQFCADVVSALTGTDYRESFPSYASREEAEAILASHGGMVGLITSVLGGPKDWKQAQRGDVVAIDLGDGVACAICLGVNCCVPGPEGLVFARTSRAIAAWSV